MFWFDASPAVEKFTLGIMLLQIFSSETGRLGTPEPAQLGAS